MQSPLYSSLSSVSSLVKLFLVSSGLLVLHWQSHPFGPPQMPVAHPSAWQWRSHVAASRQRAFSALKLSSLHTHSFRL